MFNRRTGGSLETIKKAQLTAVSEVQVQTGSFADFAQVYDALFPRIYSYVAYRINRREEVEDLVGVIFEKALLNYTKFDANKGSIENWLFTIAHNNLVNYYRSRQRRPQTQLDDNLKLDEASQPDQLILQQEEMQQLRGHLEKLNERDRELIALRYGANFSHRQIGEVLKMKESNVAVALGRAVKRLRDLFESEKYF